MIANGMAAAPLAARDHRRYVIASRGKCHDKKKNQIQFTL
jgi:hypothetical protein